jgi:hypothetical protein
VVTSVFMSDESCAVVSGVGVAVSSWIELDCRCWVEDCDASSDDIVLVANSRLEVVDVVRSNCRVFVVEVDIMY